jgi:hypothetical protein
MDTQKKLAKKFHKMKINLKEWGEEIGDCFRTSPTTGTALAYIQALLSQVERKNGWQ